MPFDTPPAPGHGSYPNFPSLPIIQGPVPGPAPKLSQSEKYGGMFYLGIAGLLAVIGMVAWFGLGVWSLRAVWSDVYALHDAKLPEADRITAALRLARNPATTQRQRWDMALETGLPAAARYLLAESLDAEAMRTDPGGYAKSIAYSEGWPDWLRLLLFRPLAYEPQVVPESAAPALLALSRGPDAILALWADATLAGSTAPDPKALARLDAAARRDGPLAELAESLAAAARDTSGPDRARRLDALKPWLREYHTASGEVWSPWAVDGDRVVPKPTVGEAPTNPDGVATR